MHFSPFTKCFQLPEIVWNWGVGIQFQNYLDNDEKLMLSSATQKSIFYIQLYLKEIWS